jgi:hypothetical protein
VVVEEEGAGKGERVTHSARRRSGSEESDTMRVYKRRKTQNIRVQQIYESTFAQKSGTRSKGGDMGMSHTSRPGACPL